MGDLPHALATNGYDVETLVQWIVTYNRLPGLARRFDFEQGGRSADRTRGFGLMVRRRKQMFT